MRPQWNEPIFRSCRKGSTVSTVLPSMRLSHSLQTSGRSVFARSASTARTNSGNGE